MATLTFQKASWCLQISRTSRLFSVSFTTALPRKGHTHHLPSPPPNALSSSRHTVQQNTPPRATSHAEARRNFTNTRVYRAQQAAATNASSRNNTTLDPQSSHSPETITPNSEDLSGGLNDKSLDLSESDGQVDWTRSFAGLSTEAFSPEAAKILLAPVDKDDIEIKPDGILYLPEIKYRRILNQAFGPGGWGLAPRGETIVTAKAVTREYALVALGRYDDQSIYKNSCGSLPCFFSQVGIRRSRRARLLFPRRYPHSRRGLQIYWVEEMLQGSRSC